MADPNILRDLVSRVYTLCDECEEGPQKTLLDFAGWCLEEAMCDYATEAEEPAAFLKAQLALWLENKAEAQTTPSAVPKSTIPFGATEEVAPYAVRKVASTILVGVRKITKAEGISTGGGFDIGKYVIIWPNGSRHLCTEEMLNTFYEPYAGPCEVLRTLDGQVSCLLPGHKFEDE